MHHREFGVLRLEPSGRGARVMRRPVVHDQEHPFRLRVATLGQDLGERLLERLDPRAGTGLPEDQSGEHVQEAEIAEGAVPLLFELHAAVTTGSGRKRVVDPGLGLETGHLVRTEHAVLRAERLPVPAALVQLQNGSGLL